VAKHAKPTVTSTLSAHGPRGAAALAMTSIGFLATAPAAFAGVGSEQGHDRHSGGDIGYRWSNDVVDAHESQGIVNVSDNSARLPMQACNNYVPINVLGVQVPVQDVAGTVAVSSDGDGEATVSPNSCHQISQHQD
jgi:hypothetical protein